MSRMSSLIAGAAIAAALSFVAAGAGTASVSVTASAPNKGGVWLVKVIAVPLADVDLATDAGAATGLQRITAASHTVCGEVEGQTMTESRTKLFDKCVKTATNYAVGNVNAPKLTEAAAH